MPEGHTLHRLARRHRTRFAGKQVSVTSPQGRFAEGAALLDGRPLVAAEAYGKHLFLGFPDERWLHVHLGLYGHWTFGTSPAPVPRGALRVRFEGNGSFADLRGPTACEVWTPVEKAVLEARLGPDPLRPRPRGDDAWDRLSRSRSAVGQLLMDQAVVAGVGNVYRAEVLFRSAMSPFRPGHLVTLMKAGLRAGRIVTTRPAHRDRPGGRVRRDDAHYVYRRTGLPCRVCRTPVATQVMAGRNLFWCPQCQAV